MGILDLFKRILGDRNAVDASTMQDIRRKQNADMARRRRERDLQTIIRYRKIKAKEDVLASLQKLEVAKPRLTDLSMTS